MCEPPQEELAKLRKVTESPEDQARREQAALAAALNGLWRSTRRLPPILTTAPPPAAAGGDL